MSAWELKGFNFCLQIPEHTDVLRTAIQRWEQIVIRDEEAQGLARQTSEFWAECAPKIAVSRFEQVGTAVTAYSNFH